MRRNTTGKLHIVPSSLRGIFQIAAKGSGGSALAGRENRAHSSGLLKQLEFAELLERKELQIEPWERTAAAWLGA